MQKTLLTIAALAAVAVPGAFATGIRYTIHGTFPANAPTSTYSAPNAPFTLTFLAPPTVPDSEPANQPFHGSAPIHAGAYVFNGFTTVFTGGTFRADDTTAGNESNVSLSTSAGLTFNLEIYGGGRAPLTPTNIPGALFLSVPGESSVQVSATSTKGVPVNGATVDVLGYYPATVPNTALSAPNAAFVAEYTIVNPAPHLTRTLFLYGSVTIQGVTYPCDVSQSYYYHSGSSEAVVCATNVGLVKLHTVGGHSPTLSRPFGAAFTVPFGDLGGGSGWAFYSSVGPTPFSSAVVLPRFIARAF